MNFQIVPFDPAYLPQVLAVEESCFTAGWSRHAFVKEAENPLSVFLLCLDKGVVCGFISGYRLLDEAHITKIAVSPSCRRQGAGNLLLSAFFQKCASLGACVFLLEVRASNHPAVAFYTKFGFLISGVRPGYYEKPKEDALLMHCIRDLEGPRL